MNKKHALVGLPSEQATEEALRERIKELRLIYSLSELAQDPAITVEQFLQATAAALPAGLRYSDDAWAAVTFAGRVFATANYAKTAWQERSMLFDGGKPVGEVLEPDEQEECLALCLSEVQRLREMTRNVLSMSRIQGEVFQTSICAPRCQRRNASTFAPARGRRWASLPACGSSASASAICQPARCATTWSAATSSPGAPARCTTKSWPAGSARSPAAN